VKTSLYDKYTIGISSETEVCYLRGILPDSATKYEPGKKGLPGTRLISDEGIQSYFYCPEIVWRLRGRPFSLSILLNIEDWKTSEDVPVDIFSFGSSVGGHKPLITLRKIYWGSKDLRLSILFGNVKYTVKKINVNKWLNKWVHLMVTWSPEGAVVYVNGRKSGRSSKVSRTHVHLRDLNEPGFYIGKITRRAKKLGEFDGTVSSLLFWDQKLTRQEARNTYRFYQDLIESSNAISDENGQLEREFLISPKMLQFLVDYKNKSCLTKPLTLTELRLEQCHIPDIGDSSNYVYNDYVEY